MLNVRPTNSTSSRLSNIGSTVSFQNDAVGDGKVFSFFVLQMVFLDQWVEKLKERFPDHFGDDLADEIVGMFLS